MKQYLIGLDSTFGSFFQSVMMGDSQNLFNIAVIYCFFFLSQNQNI